MNFAVPLLVNRNKLLIQPYRLIKMKKLLNIVCIALIVTFITSHEMIVRAEYVLPYPSFMPGNKIYKITHIVDQLKRFWYWGNIAQIKYHLGLSDKYLVEAKTLMEYNQYLLATEAMNRSDSEFRQLPKYVLGAKAEHVDITDLKKLISEAAMKHKETLSKLILTAPKEFTWTPEKAKPTELKPQGLLNDSINIRNSVVSIIGPY
jgi:hypothetical protein